MNATQKKSSTRLALTLAAALSAGVVSANAFAADEAKKPGAATEASMSADAAKPGDAAKPAEAAKSTGTVAGKVVGVDGKTAASGAKVRLLTPENAKPRKADPAAGRPGKVPAVAETDIGADGTFTLADVPPGDYVVIARLKGEGNARQKVTVAASETATVDLTLKAPPAPATTPAPAPVPAADAAK